MEAKIKLYKFKELEKDIQEKIIKETTEDERNFYCETMLEMDMTEEANDLLKKYFNIDHGCDKVYYSLGYCQGDGAMIEFTINIEDLNRKYHILNDQEMRFIQDKGIINDIQIKQEGHYYHEYCFTINYYDDFGHYDYEDIKDDYNITEEDFKTMEDRIINLLDSYNKHYTKSPFIEDIISMNKELSKSGYSYIEDDKGFKQQAIEWIEDNNFKYFADGSICNYDYEVINNE